MQGMMIIRWRNARLGHEAEAARLADETTAHFAKLAETGQVTGFEWVSNFTGTDGGMFLVRGDQQALGAIAMSPEFGAFHLRGVYHLEDWRWDMALCGSSVDEVYPGWRELVGA
jgi:hypothetical protein